MRERLLTAVFFVFALAVPAAAQIEQVKIGVHGMT